MRRLNGVDAMMLYSDTPEIHMHTLKIGVLDVSGIGGEFDIDFFRRHAYPRLMALPPLRYRLVDIPWKLHHPMWLENTEIDFDYHVRQVRVPEPGGRRELDQVISEIASTPLDRSRPLWEMYVAEGLTGNRIAVIHKVHHVLADGVASANQMGLALRPDFPGDVDVPAQEEHSRTRHLLAGAVRDHERQIRRLPKLVWDTAAGVSQVRRRAGERGAHPDIARNFAPPPSFINHLVSPGRRFASAPMAFADVKEVSKRLGVTLNDVVLATVAGALRELLLAHDGHADSPLIAGVPVCLNTSPDRLSGNEFSYLTPSLPVHIDDPLERVKLTSIATGIAKENHELLGPALIPTWLNYLPPQVAPAAFRRQSRRIESAGVMNLTVSNVTGPRQRGHVAGATVTEIYSVGPVAAGSGMNVTVWSYADQLALSVLTDDITLDDPHEATDAMLREFSEIRSAAGISGPLTEIAEVLPVAAAAR